LVPIFSHAYLFLFQIIIPHLSLFYQSHNSLFRHNLKFIVFSELLSTIALMKYLILLSLAFTMVACSPASTEIEDPNAPTVIDVNNAGSDKIDPASLSRLGESCGPSTQKLCASGLSCQFEGNAQTEGLCLPTVVNNDLECDETQNPVCGIIGNNKNGYLNECYAQRYGAEVLNEGFCTVNADSAESCTAPAVSLGNCQETFTGAAFNAETQECEAVTLVGCAVEMPFSSLRACQSAC
jgi:hypothetical protein